MNSHPATSSAPPAPVPELARAPGGPETEIFLVDLPPAAHTAATAAARQAFPAARITSLAGSSLPTAGSRGSRLAVVSRAGDVPGLVAGESGARRCAVVLLGAELSDLADAVPPEEWNPPLLARAFRSALLEQELLQENARLRGDLKTVARRISHDLRTPVGCIYTTSDVFKELPPGDSESVTSMAGIIKDSASEIAQIVDRVSFVLKASADPQPLAPVSMGGVVASVLKQLEPEIQRAHATVALPPEWPEAAGVATWLAAVWTNLIRNALQHAGPAPRLELTASSTDRRIRFAVLDRGPGVLPARVPNLFAPFERLHSMQVAGLGLCLVQRLVTLQGGTCSYEARPDGGADFGFTLPSASAE